MTIFAGMLLMLTYFFNMWACEKRWVQQWEDTSVDLATSVESRKLWPKIPSCVFNHPISNLMLIFHSLVSSFSLLCYFCFPQCFSFCGGVLLSCDFSVGNEQWGTPPGLAAVFELDLEQGCVNKAHCCSYNFSRQHTFPWRENPAGRKAACYNLFLGHVHHVTIMLSMYWCRVSFVPQVLR